MNIIEVHTSVDEALWKGLMLLREEGIREETRNGPALVMASPVMTVTKRPMNRVLFSPKRDANPFFHLMEALWMLAGRNDITWLDQFVGDFSKRFGETFPSGEMYQHGAYGFRWRAHFELEGGGGWPDQLDKAVKLLKESPASRQVVLAMWDPAADLGAVKKDIPCNTHIYLRVQSGATGETTWPIGKESVKTYSPVLDLTVCCRSNDAVWGCHGANAVHFSILQEYLAARIGVGVGTMYQLSNNYHVYDDVLKKVWPLEYPKFHYELGGPYSRIVTEPEQFDEDLKRFFSEYWDANPRYHNVFFDAVAVRLRVAYAHWRDGRRQVARAIVHTLPDCDWKFAAGDWFDRKMNTVVGS